VVHRNRVWWLINNFYNRDPEEYCRQMGFPVDTMTQWLDGGKIQLPDYMKDAIASSCHKVAVGAWLVGTANSVIVTEAMYNKIKKLCDKSEDSVSDMLSGVVTGGDEKFVGGTIDVDNILLLMQGYNITDNYLLDDNIPI